MTEFAIYGGVDHRGTVGKVAPGLFAQEGRCWRMVYANPVGQGTHCKQPVEWVGRWKFLDGWTKVGVASGTRPFSTAAAVNPIILRARCA
jgi:hypothetical protein